MIDLGLLKLFTACKELEYWLTFDFEPKNMLHIIISLQVFMSSKDIIIIVRTGTGDECCILLS